MLTKTAFSRICRSVLDSEKLLTPPLAEMIMSLGFSLEDVDRIGELSAKDGARLLSQEEQSEREAYINIAEMLSIWQKKTCEVLQQNQIFDSV